MNNPNKAPKVFRSLDNYKKLHTKTAEAKGVAREFAAAPTLTAARRVLFGLGKGGGK